MSYDFYNFSKLCSGTFTLDGLSDASTLIVEPKYPTTDDRLCYYPLETQIEGMNFKSKDPIRKPGLTLSFHVPPDPLFIKKKVFNKTPSEYRLLFNADNNTPFYISHHDYSIFHRSFFYKDRENTILIQSSYNPEVGYKLMFQTFMHTHVRIFIEELKAGGIDRLLALDTQERLLCSSFKDYDPNSEVIDLKLEYTQKADFTKGGAYSIYNWELFFHAPFLIANHLSKNQRFAEAQQWFHYIFDPTTNSSYPTAARYWRMREFHEYAKRPPIEELMVLLAKSADEQTISPEQQELIDQVEIWRQNPFKPHAIARWRTSAYQKVVVMKYLDNLIAWGDQLFRRDTIETINEATQLYILADQILGRRPEQLPRRTQPLVHTYNALVKDHVLDSFSNALVEAENLLPPSRTTVSTGQPITPPTLLFCIPPNDKLLEYWNTVSDRLFKIRHCMNIAGIVRKLPLFEPPIDPALLVKAAAAGIDISSALSDRNAPLPYYRFNILVQKASELCSEVKSMGAALLSALEKKDAEQIALLRSSHEISLLEATRAIKILQVEEAKASLEALTKSLESPGARLRYYMQLLSAVETIVVEPTSQEPLGERLLTTYTEFVDTLSLGLDPSAQAIKASLQLKEIVTPVAKKALDQLEKTLSQEGGVDFKLTTPADPSEKVTLPMNPYEKRQLDELRKSHDKQKQAMDYELLAQVLALIPDLKIGCPPTIGATFGGTFLSTAARVFANQFNYEATEYSYRANLHSILAGYQRRFAEWILQARTAVLEIEQISAQIATAGIRSAITKAELDNHTRQIDNAKAVDALMHEKYTNQELYEWMIGQISSNYLASYQLAYDVAKRAERAYRFELGLTDSNFIQFGYWDNLKKGLLAGESLYHDLKRMEIAYLDQNKREYEITKQVSLKLHNPLALITLKENGICEIELPEALFDADYPGHYMRRIKSVSLSIPCVTGPYTSINCTLTLLTNKTRIKNIADENYGQPEENEGCFVTNFAATQSIATSTAQNDSGMFEVNFRDERYLPFEGAGAISRWRIDMPKDCNAFDFDTISDVILKLNYTAREGGEILRQAARRSLNLQVTALSSLPHGEGPMRMFSLRHEFPAEWNQFFHPSNHATAQSMDLKISKEQFPFQLRGQTGIQITKVDMFLKLKEISETEPPSPSSLDLILFQPSSDTTEGNKIKLENITPNPGQASGKLLYGHCTTTGGWGTWSLKIQEAGITPLNKAIEDIILICHYSVSQQGNP
jgi:hypothetical protein